MARRGRRRRGAKINRKQRSKSEKDGVARDTVLCIARGHSMSSVTLRPPRLVKNV